MSLLLWILLATLYLVLLWTLGIRTFTNGHYVLFFVGIVFPIVLDRRRAHRPHG